MAAAAAAEAAAMQGRFWDMHQLLFHRQNALEDDDLREYAIGLRLDSRYLAATGPETPCFAASAGT